MRTGSMPSEFAKYARRDLLLPEAMRAELAQPLGPVLNGGTLLSALEDTRFVIAVGDVVAAYLHASGRTPDVAIVDYRTKRAEDPALRRRLRDVGNKVAVLTNPAGRISREAWPVLLEAFKAGDRVRVEVRGEEDLLALVAIALAPDGAAVVYGQPDQGAVVVRVDARARSRVASVLRRMQ